MKRWPSYFGVIVLFTISTLHSLLFRNNMDLQLLNFEEKQKLLKNFVKDLESFSLYDKAQESFLPVICCVCDSMPHTPDWHRFEKVSKLQKLFDTCKLQRDTISDLYPERLLNDYKVSDSRLQDYVLSPSTYINENDEVLICKSCFAELEMNAAKRKRDANPPMESIVNGYVIGKTPFELSDCNDVELALTSRARIYTQSWVFFAGCHQHIKGWHTILKNQHENHIGNLQVLQESGMSKIILVALCGPFTTTQRALTLAKTAVDPQKVIRAWEWFKANCFRHKDDKIPHIDDIPTPKILEDKMYVFDHQHVIYYTFQLS